MTKVDSSNPSSTRPANTAPSLTDSLSDAMPTKYSTQPVGSQSDEIKGLSETFEKNSSHRSFGPVILPLSDLQPNIFSTVETLRSSNQRAPSAVVLSCPHAGRIYPAEFINASIADITDLRGLEDFGVDQIVNEAVEIGIPCVTNKITRAYIDVNRPVDALDHLMLRSPPVGADATPSRHVRAGYGLLPRLTAAREVIHRQLLPYDEVERRIALVHQPYHSALKNIVNTAKKKSGYTILIDCHSMPSRDQQNRPLADIILGNLHHNTLDKKIGKMLASLIEAEGFSIAWNSPYAGGYITKNYGRANSTQQSIQIEFNRRLYMNRKYELDNGGVERVSNLLTKVCIALSDLVITV